MEKVFKKEIGAYIKSLCLRHQIDVSTETFNEIYFDLYIPKLSRVFIFHSFNDSANDHYYSLKEVKHSDDLLQVVHIWEDQWLFNKNKIESRIASMLGITKRIHGRETNIVKIDNDQLLKFLSENHMNVPIKAQHKYGLTKNQELVAVMSFSKGRTIIRNNKPFNSFELLRFCNKLEVTVVGGFSKLLNHFISKNDPDDIMTYVDADWSDGQSLSTNGFHYIETMPTMEFWLNIQTGDREYPHMVLKKLNKSMDINISEKDKSMFLRKLGYLQVFNSGSYKYILLRK